MAVTPTGPQLRDGARRLDAVAEAIPGILRQVEAAFTDDVFRGAAADHLRREIAATRDELRFLASTIRSDAAGMRRRALAIEAQGG